MNFSALCKGEPGTFEPGIHSNVLREVYDRIPALSCTVLKEWFIRSIPSEFAYWLKTRWEEPTSEALVIGSAVDCKLLDGNFLDRFAVAPTVDRRTNAGKAQWSAFVAANKSKTVLTATQAEKVEAMTASILKASERDETLDGVLPNCKKTVLCAELWGLPCKAEVDLFTRNSIHLLDLKTARDVSDHWFAKAFIDYLYDCQGTFYLLLAQACGLDKKIFDFLAVKNEPPFTCKVHVFDTDDDDDHELLFRAWRIRLERAANEIAARLQANNFTDSKDWNRIKVPEYVLHQAHMEILSITGK